MEQEARLGKLLMEGTTSAVWAVIKWIFFLLLALALIVIMVIGLVDPDMLGFYEEDTIFIFLIGVAGLASLVASIIFTKVKYAALYEYGIIFGPIKKLRNFHFEEIAGIQLKAESTTVLDGGIIGSIITGLLSRFIPFLNTRSLEIYKKEGNWAEKMVEMERSKTSNFEQLVEELEINFTEWLTKDITMENINEKEIGFGSDLKLTGGNFVFNQGKKGDLIIGFNEISGTTFNDEGWCWLLGTELDKRGNPVHLARVEYNTAALVRLVDMIKAS